MVSVSDVADCTAATATGQVWLYAQTTFCNEWSNADKS